MRPPAVRALREHFGVLAVVAGDAAGMHAFVSLTDKGLVDRARRNKVQLRGAQPCYLEGDYAQRNLFGLSSLKERDIREGIRRLAR